MGFPRQEYWSGLPFPSPGYLPNPEIEPMSPTLQADALTSAPPGKPLNTRIQSFRKPPIETQQRFQGRKGSQVERRRGRRWEGGRGKGWPYRRLLPPTDSQGLWDFSLGLQRREDWNSALPEIRTRIRVSLQSSAQAEGPSTRFLRPGPGD